MRNMVRVALSILCCYAAGMIASLFIGSDVSGWYAGLSKPPLSPSLAFFPIVLVILYALIGIASAVIWLQDKPHEHHSDWQRFFFIGLLLNAGWIVFFFAFHGLFFAFIDSLILLFFIVGLMATAYHIDRRAYYLLWPYVLFVLWLAYFTGGVWYLY